MSTVENENSVKTINESSSQQEPIVSKKVYNTPKLQRFGALAELVQNSPGRAGDGGPFADCTFS